MTSLLTETEVGGRKNESESLSFVKLHFWNDRIHEPLQRAATAILS